MPTVFVTQLAQRVRHADVSDLFARAGRVRDVRLVMDRHTGRHKGAAYVEYFEREALTAAVRLSGTVLCGFPVEVRAWDDGGRRDWRGPRSDRERAPEAEAPTDGPGVTIGWSSRPPMRRQEGGGSDGNGIRTEGGAPVVRPIIASTSGSHPVAPVPQLVSIDELKVLLNPKNLRVTTYLGGMGHHGAGGSTGPPRVLNGNGSLNGVERVPLPVAAGAEATTRVYIGGLGMDMTGEKLKEQFSGCGEIVWCEMERGVNGRGIGIGGVEFVTSLSAKAAVTYDGRVVDGKRIRVGLRRRDVQDESKGDGELDEGGGDKGLNLNAGRRVMLMQELSRGEPVSGRRLRGDVEKLKGCDAPTTSIMLNNMFDPSAEKEGFEQDVAEDVRDECASQYGKVVHVYVEKESHGVVYVRFQRVQDAVKGRNQLNGRWFGGNKILATFVNDQLYLERFPDEPVQHHP